VLGLEAAEAPEAAAAAAMREKKLFKLNWQCADKSHEQFLIADIASVYCAVLVAATSISPQFVFTIKP
jgi:hypothetical protein